MQEQKYEELRERSTEVLERLFNNERVLARQVVRSQVEEMLKSGEAMQLTDEEERMLRSFRRFKATIHKAGEVFKWQTRPLEADLLVLFGDESVHITDPQDVSVG